VLYGWSVVRSFERTRGQDSNELLPVLVAVPVIHTKLGNRSGADPRVGIIASAKIGTATIGVQPLSKDKSKFTVERVRKGPSLPFHLRCPSHSLNGYPTTSRSIDEAMEPYVGILHG